jgi:hypothetical protein
MTDLIARLEALTKPSRELDGEIYAAQSPPHLVHEADGIVWVASRYTMHINPDGSERKIDTWKKSKKWCDDQGLCYGAAVQDAPKYTSSIDAALSLVPTGWRICDLQDASLFKDIASVVAIDNAPSYEPWHFRNERGMAATPAIALCIAALKAGVTK